MRDIALAAGVSKMTVSRALKKDSPVSPDTRERILKVVREMNYVPDQTAGSLTTKRSGFVALLVPSLNNLHFAQTVQALTEELENIGQQLLLGHTDYSQKREEKLVEDMLKRRPEAIILSYDGHSPETVRLLSQVNVPVIELWERPSHPLEHTIGFSNRDASFAMTQKLIECGYRNIAFLGEDEDDWTRGAARREGFVAAMKKAGLSSKRMLRLGKPPLSIEDGARAGPKLLSLYPDTDCIFCVSDVPAFGVISSLNAQGMDIPGNIGVAGFGNFEISRFSKPTITTVIVDPKRIGQAAGKLIADLLDPDKFQDAAPKHLTIDALPILRSSTRTIAL